MKGCCEGQIISNFFLQIMVSHPEDQKFTCGIRSSVFWCVSHSFQWRFWTHHFVHQCFRMSPDEGNFGLEHLTEEAAGLHKRLILQLFLPFSALVSCFETYVPWLKFLKTYSWQYELLRMPVLYLFCEDVKSTKNFDIHCVMRVIIAHVQGQSGCGGRGPRKGGVNRPQLSKKLAWFLSQYWSLLLWHHSTGGFHPFDFNSF